MMTRCTNALLKYFTEVKLLLHFLEVIVSLRASPWLSLKHFFFSAPQFIGRRQPQVLPSMPGEMRRLSLTTFYMTRLQSRGYYVNHGRRGRGTDWTECCVGVRLELMSSLNEQDPQPNSDLALGSNPCPALASCR